MELILQYTWFLYLILKFKDSQDDRNPKISSDSECQLASISDSQMALVASTYDEISHSNEPSHKVDEVCLGANVTSDVQVCTEDLENIELPVSEKIDHEEIETQIELGKGKRYDKIV